ncbi:MAG: hypothetical protein HPM95_15245 [Alphaproteobacteria bacterium]|nr:hypothetical protein [Alphaproteobacteria bacterium]
MERLVSTGFPASAGRFGPYANTGFASMTRFASVASVCLPRDRLSYRPLALPLAVALLSATALTPAEAGCSISNKVETCSGAMNGAIVHDQSGVHTLTLKGITNNLDAFDSP